MTVEEYYRSIDPNFGSKPHQREFLERMARAQELNPCPKTHDEPEIMASDREAPRCHRTSCYPTNPQGRMVGA